MCIICLSRHIYLLYSVTMDHMHPLHHLYPTGGAQGTWTQLCLPIYLTLRDARSEPLPFVKWKLKLNIPTILYTVRTSQTRAFDSYGLYGCNTMYALIISCRSCFSAVPRLNNSVFTGGIHQVKVEVEPYNHTGRTFWTSAYDAYGLYVCNTMYAWIISCRRYFFCCVTAF